MMLLKVSIVDGTVKRKMFDIPKMNYCAWQRSGESVPILSDLLKLAAKHSNMVFRCPAKPGFYWAKDYPIKEMPIAPVLPIGTYVFSFHVSDEHQKKALTFFRLEFFLTKTF